MGTREDQERLRIFKRDYPQEYAAKVAEIIYRKKHENEVLEQQGYLVGCRSWNIILTVEGLRLLSSSNTIWPCYEKLVAVCSNGRNHIVPDRECMCGVYCMKFGKHIPVDGSIQGRVKLWGRFLEADYGYRAELAYPEKLESFVCFRCGKIFEEWSEAYGFTTMDLTVRFWCITCYNQRYFIGSKYAPKFFSGTDVLQDLNEAYGLVRSWDDILEGIDLDLEG